MFRLTNQFDDSCSLWPTSFATSIWCNITLRNANIKKQKARMFHYLFFRILFPFFIYVLANRIAIQHFATLRVESGNVVHAFCVSIRRSFALRHRFTQMKRFTTADYEISFSHLQTSRTYILFPVLIIYMFFSEDFISVMLD